MILHKPEDGSSQRAPGEDKPNQLPENTAVAGKPEPPALIFNVRYQRRVGAHLCGDPFRLVRACSDHGCHGGQRMEVIARRIPSELVTPAAIGVPSAASTAGMGRHLLGRWREGLLKSSQCQAPVVTILKGEHGLYLWVLNEPTEAPRERASARAPRKVSPEAGTVPGLLTVDSAVSKQMFVAALILLFPKWLRPVGGNGRVLSGTCFWPSSLPRGRRGDEHINSLRTNREARQGNREGRAGHRPRAAGREVQGETQHPAG